MLDEHGAVERRPELGVLQPAPDSVDDVACVSIRGGGLVAAARRIVQAADRGVSLPELARVADLLRDGEGLIERCARLVPLPSGRGDLTFEAPALHQVLAG